MFSQYVFIVLAFLSNVASIVFGILNAIGERALFHNSIANLTEKYMSEVKPVPICFEIIWPIIYVWTLAANVYLLASMCLPNNQSPLKFIPTLIPQTFLVGIIVGSCASVIWLFTYDREMILVSSIVLVVSSVALWHAISISLTVVHDNESKIIASSTVMLWVMRILVHNGLCLLGTWGLVASMLGFTDALVYKDSAGSDTALLTGFVNQQDACTVGLAIVFVLMLLMFGVQNFTAEPYFRYIFTIFPVFIFSLSGIVARISDGGSERNLAIAGVNLALSIVLFIIRITLAVFKIGSSKDRYYPTKSSHKIDLLDDYY